MIDHGTPTRVSFQGSKFDLKINRSMQMAWQEYSGVARSYSSAPDQVHISGPWTRPKWWSMNPGARVHSLSLPTEQLQVPYGKTTTPVQNYRQTLQATAKSYPFFLVWENRAQFGALDFSNLGNKCHKAAISARFSTNLFSRSLHKPPLQTPPLEETIAAKSLVSLFFFF